MNVLKKTKKIIALPYAGGSKYCYRSFETIIPDDFEWITLELPGRGDRMDEDFFMNIKDMAEDIFSKILPIIKSSEYILYGHSLGTILGYELMKKITASKLSMPLFLFFTGRDAPSVPEEEKLAELGRELFWKKIEEIGGMPIEILKSEDLKDFLGPIIRSDFSAVENYQFVGLDKAWKVPLYIRIGNEELIGEGNNIIKWNGILSWQDITEYPMDVKFYKGDHFFIFEHTETLVQEIVRTFKKYSKTKNGINYS